MRNYKISLAGDLGSGKSTIAKFLTEKYGLEKVSIGSIQRQMAQKMNMDTCEFNKYMESHPEFDNILDTKLSEYEKIDGRFLFDSRLAWHFVPSSFKVYMKVSPQVAGKRVYNAERADETYSSVEDAVDKLIERRRSERERFLQFYNVDITDLSNYDFVIDTENKTIQQVVNQVCEAFETWLNQN